MQNISKDPNNQRQTFDVQRDTFKEASNTKKQHNDEIISLEREKEELDMNEKDYIFQIMNDEKTQISKKNKKVFLN